MQPPSDGASESAKIWYTVNWLPLLYSLLFIDTVVVGWRGGRWGGRQLAAGHWSLLISKCQCPPPHHDEILHQVDERGQDRSSDGGSV